MVGTPIGNLEDITLRALKTLKEVDVIACEDTRHTSNLLTHFDIKKRLIACHSYNEEESAKGIISLLDQGLSVAYCSDAGTPGVSDPGARLVERVRRESDHNIVPIPGASASVTLVSASSYEKDFGYGGNKEAAKKVGAMIAERAKAKGITQVVFDRGGNVYQGRVKELADGAREGGLEF